MRAITAADRSSHALQSLSWWTRGQQPETPGQGPCLAPVFDARTLTSSALCAQPDLQRSLPTYTTRDCGAAAWADLVGVVRRRQPGPDVQELADACLHD
jgi:hypothetical protein